MTSRLWPTTFRLARNPPVLRGMQRKKREKAPKKTSESSRDIIRKMLPDVLIPKGPRPNLPLTERDLDVRAGVVKQYTRYRLRQSRIAAQQMRQAEECRDEALAEALLTDEKLFYDCIEVDTTPFPLMEPMTETPPIESFRS